MFLNLLFFLSATPTLAEESIVDIAVANPDFSMLAKAVVTAGLADTLSGEGPFTVFAPTDPAFDRLYAELGVDGPGNLSISDLTDILTYHVISGVAAQSGDLVDGQVLETVEGSNLTVAIEGDEVKIMDATQEAAHVITANVNASNGVIHVIDKVLLSNPTIIQVATSTPGTEILVAALKAADLVEPLTDMSMEYTVFAPTNESFELLLEQLNYTSIEEVPKGDLQKILLYHVAVGEALSTDLVDGMSIPTALEGQNLTVDLSSGVMLMDTTDEAATVIIPDVEAKNGVIHVVDKVLLPALE